MPCLSWATPLTAIIGFSNLLTGIEGLPDQAATYARRISTGGQGLLPVHAEKSQGKNHRRLEHA